MKQLDNGLFPKIEVAMKNKMIAYLLVENSIIHNLSAPQKHAIPNQTRIVLIQYMVPWNATKELSSVMYSVEVQTLWNSK